MTFSQTIKLEIVRKNINKQKGYALLWAYFSFYKKNYIENNYIKFNNKINLDYFKYNLDLLEISNEIKDKLTIEIKDKLNDYLFANKEYINDFNELERISFLEIMFLLTGSINDPKKAEYHLEFSLKNYDISLLILAILNDYNLNSKITKRKNNFVVYIKEAEKISDFLKLIDCQSGLFEYENIRIQRDMNNSINRIYNIEISNEIKALNSAKKEVRTIKKIFDEYGRENLDKKLVEIMDLRLENPTDTLKELAEKYYRKYNKKISKSGINHRINKIYDLL